MWKEGVYDGQENFPITICNAHTYMYMYVFKFAHNMCGDITRDD